MVPSLGLNRSSNVVPVGPHEIEQTNDLDTREGGYIYIHGQLTFVLLLPICQQSETRPGPRTGRGHRFTVGQVPSQLLVRETISSRIFLSFLLIDRKSLPLMLKLFHA